MRELYCKMLSSQRDDYGSRLCGYHLNGDELCNLCCNIRAFWASGPMLVQSTNQQPLVSFMSRVLGPGIETIPFWLDLKSCVKRSGPTMEWIIHMNAMLWIIRTFSPSMITWLSLLTHNDVFIEVWASWSALKRDFWIPKLFMIRLEPTFDAR